MPKLIEIQFPEKLTAFVMAAFVVGGLLVIGSFVAAAGEWGTPSSVLLGAGIGIIVTAFGGQATVTGKVFVVAGVTAAAALLIWFIEQQVGKTRDALDASYVRGQIFGFSEVAKVALLFGSPALGNLALLAEPRPKFEYVVFRSELNSAGQASLQILRNGAQDYESIAIQNDCFLNAMGRDTDFRLDWRYILGPGDVIQIWDTRSNTVIGQSGQPLEENPCPLADDSATASAGSRGNAGLGLFNAIGLGITPAYAQEVLPPPLTLTDAEVSTLLQQMLSDDVEIRREARNRLAFASDAQVSLLMEAVRSVTDPNDLYRTQLGVAVAFTEMLRRDPDRANTLDDILTRSDLDLLLDMAGNTDRTLRVYGTEFLYVLGDAEATTMALERAGAPNETGHEGADIVARYQYVFVAYGGWAKGSSSRQLTWAPLVDDVLAVTTADDTATRNLLTRFE